MVASKHSVYLSGFLYWSLKIYVEAHHHQHYLGQESIFRCSRLVTRFRKLGIYWRGGPGARECWLDRQGLGDFSRSVLRCLHVPKRSTYRRIAVEPGGSIQWQFVFSCYMFSIEEIGCPSTVVLLPNAAEANESQSRAYHRGSLLNLLKDFIATNEVWVVRERYRQQGFRAGFRWL